MTDARVISMPLPDQPARDRVRGDLDTNLFVEAGAGSGKTSELVKRLVALVASGTAEVEQIAAVTFTRKAAGELRERFQTDLEAALRSEEEAGDGAGRARLRRALETIDRAFVGTIHAFCARLLRERPLEAGLDPAFQELAVDERATLRRRFWEEYLDRVTRDADPVLDELATAGLRPTRVRGLFETLSDNPDVRFPADEVALPDPAELVPIRAELESIVDEGMTLMPEHEPAKGWDPLQKAIRRLAFTRDLTGWAEPAQLYEAIVSLCKPGERGHDITQKRWTDGGRAKGLQARADAFGVGDTEARGVATRWYAHRYGLAVRLASRAAAEFAQHRRRIGKLDYEDLLSLAARLLRRDPRVRGALGARYRYLLIDEFQDTDPLQAEIMLLLASQPAEPSSGTEADWRTAAPRPGALFVVGDPKQSIYRFRRADIQLYDWVKRRFGEFGEVLRLTANFRSRPPIGDLVNELFDAPDFFPRESTPEQAAFEPLNTRPSDGGSGKEGVFWYDVEPPTRGAPAVAEDDAARLATWIEARIRTGDRTAGDFLVLTRMKKGLDTYARALEERSVPIQVTGASVGMDEEILELIALLECIADPTNPVKVLAALVGLFFGLDYERLVDHRLGRGSLDAVRPGEEGHPEVLEALRRLHRWWRASATEPADILVERIVAEVGLLAFAAGGELGTIRAGAVVYALDAVRAAALAGDASLPGALEALRAAFLEVPEAEAPLQPGRADVVRIMNLHQAKGLEATVVVLADPSRLPERSPERHVVRGDDGEAVGYVVVTEPGERYTRSNVLALPEGWESHADAEQRFEQAEHVRLLYVAVTRAKQELVVARWGDRPHVSAWAALDPWLTEHAEPLELEPGEAAPRERVTLTPEALRAEVEAASRRLALMGVPSYRHVSVTELAKEGAPEGPAADLGGAGSPPDVGEVTRERSRGYAWGSAVHGALAAAAHDPPPERLRVECRALLVENERPLDSSGDPVELDELLGLVAAVRASELWRRAESSEAFLTEVPFASPEPVEGAPAREDAAPDTSPGGRPQLDLFVAGARAGAAMPSPDGVGLILEGVIDLAFREVDGWVIADYKTDVGTDPEFEARVVRYRRQVDLYGEAWTRLTGEPVKERVLFFTAQNRIESW